jgi:hypothetical protein
MCVVVSGIRAVPGARVLTGDPPGTRFVDTEGVERQELLDDVAGLPFEAGVPVRSFPSYRGQLNWPGWWWSATSGALVGYESWLEREHAMALDFEGVRFPAVLVADAARWQAAFACSGLLCAAS